MTFLADRGSSVRWSPHDPVAYFRVFSDDEKARHAAANCSGIRSIEGCDRSPIHGSPAYTGIHRA
jgi:hypothetical protein